MRVDLLTREYPPHIYGGAGVHVTELAAVLRDHIEVRVRAFDGPRGEPGVTGYEALGGGVGDASLDVKLPPQMSQKRRRPSTRGSTATTVLEKSHDLGARWPRHDASAFQHGRHPCFHFGRQAFL